MSPNCFFNESQTSFGKNDFKFDIHAMLERVVVCKSKILLYKIYINTNINILILVFKNEISNT